MNTAQEYDIPELRSIDWDITPELTFTMFESWGSRLWLRSQEERFYYFFIDDWKTPARLCLMERGLKYARIVAEVDAPQSMVDSCIKDQGKKTGLDRSYAINKEIKQWLLDNIIHKKNPKNITLIEKDLEKEDMKSGLPSVDDRVPQLKVCRLRDRAAYFSENDLLEIVKKYDFFDTKYNPDGNFTGYLVDNNDNTTVTDDVTGLMWQRHGTDITSIRKVQNILTKHNQEAFGGYSDWRLPTIEEALSLMTREKGRKGLHIHHCFSKKQPFIFLADQRKPGGYWFADYKQGTIFWASGTIPGGFGRFCRTV